MIENKQVAGYITRSYMLYKTDVEYGDWAMNHVSGCAHACRYCYAYLRAKRWGRVFDINQWSRPYLVSNTLELLEKEIPMLIHENSPTVHLSFTTDPFMYGYAEVSKLSIESIALLNNSGIPCTTLTKGVLPQELAMLSRNNMHGATITSLDEEFCKHMEPGAAPCFARINSLLELHRAKIPVWVSIEPFFVPNIHDQNLKNLLDAVSFADKIVFGRAHYVKGTAEYPNYKGYYNYQAAEVIDYGQRHGIQVHIKEKTITPHDMCSIIRA